MKKRLIVIALLLFAIVVLVGVALWYFMGKPLYQPGMVQSGRHLRASLTPPAQKAQTDFWNVESDIQLFHFADGSGKKVLVVHGGPGYPFTQPLAGLQPLINRYEFIYYDQRGCGKSTRPFDRFASTNYFKNMTVLEQTLGLGAQIADIERIRQLLGEEKLTIVGHSFGAFLAALYAAEFPDRVRGLVLVSPATVLVMPATGGGLYAQISKLLPDSLKQAYNDFQAEYFNFSKIFTKSEAELAALNQRFARWYGAAIRQHSIGADASSISETGGWMTFAMYFSMGKRHDYRAALKKVTAPVLVIHGTDDLQSEQESRVYAEAFPNASFSSIADAGHFSFTDQPTPFAILVGQFLDGLN